MRRRPRFRVRTQPQLFPIPEETVPLAEEALRAAIQGLAELVLRSLERNRVHAVKGGTDEPEDHA